MLQEPATYIASEERIAAERAAFAFVVGTQDDEDILESHNERQRPDDNGQDLYQIVV